MRVAKSVFVTCLWHLACILAERVDSGEDSPLLQQNYYDSELEQEREDDARMAALMELASHRAVRRLVPEKASLVEAAFEEPPVLEARAATGADAPALTDAEQAAALESATAKAAATPASVAASTSKRTELPWDKRIGMMDDILGMPDLPKATYEEGLALGAAAAVMEEVAHPDVVASELADLKTVVLLGSSKFAGQYRKISNSTRDFLRTVSARMHTTYESMRKTMDWSIGPLVLQEAASITDAQRKEGKALVTLLAYADALEKQEDT
jgi:hypothetical protein